MKAALDRLQRHLEAINAIEVGERAADYLIGDDVLRSLVDLGWAPEGTLGTPEQVLVAGDGDALEIAVYLADRVQRGFEAGSLQDHCHAAEGVSHFLMLLWSGAQQRKVRLLDLELQGEVDKAATVLLLDRGATGGRGGRYLLDRLFVAPDFLPHLDGPARARYADVHHVAARYGDRLLALLDRGVDVLLAELRTFYRLPPEGKRARALAA